jgi:hypothetical protein
VALLTMSSIFDREGGKRWPRSQRFVLSVKGAEAEQAYREMITASRTGSGRTAFDAARTAWAQPLAIQPGDGLYLGELQPGARTLEELTRALESCGSTRREIKAALDRLIDAGMIEAQAAPPPPSSASSWR